MLTAGDSAGSAPASPPGGHRRIAVDLASQTIDIRSVEGRAPGAARGAGGGWLPKNVSGPGQTSSGDSGDPRSISPEPCGRQLTTISGGSPEGAAGSAAATSTTAVPPACSAPNNSSWV